MSGNTDGSSLGGMDGEMNENTGSVSLPGKNKFKSSSVWRCRCSGKSLQLCIQKKQKKNMPVSYKHNDERQVHWSVHIYLAMQCFFLCKYFGSFRCNASFKTIHCSKKKETLN